MKLGEVVVHIEYYNFTKFHYIIVLYQTHLMDGPSVRGRGIGPNSTSFVSNTIFGRYRGNKVSCQANCTGEL